MDFLCGKGDIGESIKPQYKFLLWNGNCWAGLEQGMLELAYLFGRCLMVLHHPQPLELPGLWRAQCVVVGWPWDALPTFLVWENNHFP